MVVIRAKDSRQKPENESATDCFFFTPSIFTGFTFFRGSVDPFVVSTDGWKHGRGDRRGLRSRVSEFCECSLGCNPWKFIRGIL